MIQRHILIILLFLGLGTWAQEQEISIQPNVDAMITSALVNLNAGSDVGWTAQAWTQKSAYIERSLMQFSIDQIPEGALITEAYISLQGKDHLYYAPKTNKALIRRVTGSWTENLVTWANQPSATNEREITLEASQSATQDYQIDIQHFVQSWLDGDDANYGIMIQLETEEAYARMSFHSSDATNPADRPEVVIKYIPPLSQTINTSFSAVLNNLQTQQNVSNSPYLTASHLQSGDLAVVERGLLKFSMGNLPEDAVVISAQLKLHSVPTPYSSNGTNAAQILLNTGTWSSSTVSWSTQPATTISDSIQIPTDSITTAQTLVFDITDQAQAWIHTPSENYGVNIQLQDESQSSNAILKLASSYHPNPSLRPSIELTYYIPYHLVLAPSQDANVSSTYTGGYNSNYFSAEVYALKVGNGINIGLMQFDLSSVPDNVVLEQASLKLHKSSSFGSNNSAYLSRNTESWGSSVTYATKPRTTSTGQVQIDDQVPTTFNVDIKHFVNDWMANPSNNYGVQLHNRTVVATNRLVFYSSDYSNTSLHPSLDILLRPMPLQLSVVTQDCNSGNNGSIDLTVSGGIAPYTYDWNQTYQTEDLSSLSPGHYRLLVTDAVGQTATKDVYVHENVQWVATQDVDIVSGTIEADAPAALWASGARTASATNAQEDYQIKYTIQSATETTEQKILGYTNDNFSFTPGSFVYGLYFNQGNLQLVRYGIQPEVLSTYALNDVFEIFNNTESLKILKNGEPIHELNISNQSRLRAGVLFAEDGESFAQIKTSFAKTDHAYAIDNDTRKGDKRILLPISEVVLSNAEPTQLDADNLICRAESGSTLYRSLLRVYANQLPEGAVVSQANLVLTNADLGGNFALTGNNQVDVAKVAATWDETTVTYANQPSTAVGVESIAASSTADTQVKVDITTWFSAWLADESSNHGMQLKLNNESSIGNHCQSFYSSKATDKTKRPYVELYYYVPIQLEATIPIIKDATSSSYISGGDANQGSFEHMIVESSMGNATNSFFELDLSQIPNNAVINSANLYLMASGTHDLSSNNAQLKMNTEAWDEMTVTYNNAPATLSSDVITLPAPTSTTQDYEVDITTQVRLWKDQLVENHGFTFTHGFAASAYLKFASSDHTDADLRPYVKINYTVQPLALYAEEEGTHVALMATGGVPPYTYRWSDGNSSGSRSDLTAGQHFVSVTDATGSMSIRRIDYASGDLPIPEVYENAEYNWSQTQIYNNQGSSNFTTATTKTYTDDIGNVIQTVSLSPTTQQKTVVQPLYNEYGEAVGSSLPAVVDANNLNFVEGFMSPEGYENSDYSYYFFDKAETAGHELGELNNPYPVSRNSVLGAYYSSANAEELYVPESDFPYTRAYTNAYGNMQKNALAGEAHKMGSGHESKVFSLSLSSDELFKLFGFDGWQENPQGYIFPFLGAQTHDKANIMYNKSVQKQITVDPDGRQQVAYTVGGQPVATAQAGTFEGENMMRDVFTAEIPPNTNYVDIHIPEGCEDFLSLDFSFGGSYAIESLDENISTYSRDNIQFAQPYASDHDYDGIPNYADIDYEDNADETDADFDGVIDRIDISYNSGASDSDNDQIIDSEDTDANGDGMGDDFYDILFNSGSPFENVESDPGALLSTVEQLYYDSPNLAAVRCTTCGNLGTLDGADLTYALNRYPSGDELEMMRLNSGYTSIEAWLKDGADKDDDVLVVLHANSGSDRLFQQAELTIKDIPAGFYRIKYTPAKGMVAIPKVRYKLNYYNHALNFYNNKGELAKSVKPKGVNYNFDPALEHHVLTVDEDATVGESSIDFTVPATDKIAGYYLKASHGIHVNYTPTTDPYGVPYYSVGPNQSGTGEILQEVTQVVKPMEIQPKSVAGANLIFHNQQNDTKQAIYLRNDSIFTVDDSTYIDVLASGTQISSPNTLVDGLSHILKVTALNEPMVLEAYNQTSVFRPQLSLNPYLISAQSVEVDNGSGGTEPYYLQSNQTGSGNDVGADWENDNYGDVEWGPGGDMVSPDRSFVAKFQKIGVYAVDNLDNETFIDHIYYMWSFCSGGVQFDESIIPDWFKDKSYLFLSSKSLVGITGFKLKIEQAFNYSATGFSAPQSSTTIEGHPDLAIATQFVANEAPQHNESTTYTYGKGGRLIKVVDSESGTSDQLYACCGRQRFSRNELQANNHQFVYNNYDAVGRVVETGVFDTDLTAGTPYFFEVEGGDLEDNANAVNQFLTQTLPVSESDNGVRYYQKKVYDRAIDLSTFNTIANLNESALPIVQNNLNGRVSYTYAKDKDNDAINSLKLFSYDEWGRLEAEAEVIDQAFVTTVHYEYDLMGNVLKKTYNKTKTDELLHEYEYDLDSRLSSVSTGRGGNTPVLQAAYEYYLHGPLKRIELGGDLQGVDYVYTINGWLKSINHPSLGVSQQGQLLDPGKDGGLGSSFKTDVFGMSLDYYMNDYVRNRNTSNWATFHGQAYIDDGNLSLNQSAYNGNIKQVRWKTSAQATDPAALQNDYHDVYRYTYDELNRLKTAEFGMYYQDYSVNPSLPQLNQTASVESSIVGVSGSLEQNQALASYLNNVSLGTVSYANFMSYEPTNSTTGGSYELMGTATEYLTLNQSLEHSVDYAVGNSLVYGYHANPNQDYAVDITYEKGSLGQTHGNIKFLDRNKKTAQMDDFEYVYNAGDRLDILTDLVSNKGYFYNAIGQTTHITDDEVAPGTVVEAIEYNHLGLAQQVTNALGTEYYSYNASGLLVKKEFVDLSSNATSTYYSRDASGRIQATYEKVGTGSIGLIEQPIYGLARVGTHQLGTTYYEINDHLGNVRATVSKESGTGNLIKESHADYYPFGSLMPDRNSSPTKYRHGYQGQFAEQNTKTGYNDFILRNYNSQTGRWFAPDPYKQHFSPYVGMGNNPVNGVDPDGGFFNTDTYAGRMALRRAKWAIQNAMMSFSLSLLRPSPGNNWDRYAGIGPSNPSSLENLDIRLAIMGMPDTDMGRALVIGKIMNKISEAKKYGYDLTSDMVAAGREINLFFEVLKAKQAYEAARDAQIKIDRKRAEAKMTASNIGYGKAYHRPPPETGIQLISDVYRLYKNVSSITWTHVKVTLDALAMTGSMPGIPDNISLDLTVGSTFGRGASMTYSVNLLTVGEDVGFHLTHTEQYRYGAEFELGLNLNFSYYQGNKFGLNSSSLLGPVRSVSGGFGFGANAYIGYDSSYHPYWYGGGVGVGQTFGGSYGYGTTKKGWLSTY